MNKWRREVFGLKPGHVSPLFTRPGNRVPLGREFESILVLDSWLPHKDKGFIKKMSEENGVKVVINPGGMTSLLQPADITWNREVKRKFKNYWREWIEKKSDSDKGNLKRPEYGEIIDWVYKAWNELDRQIIIDSFKFANLGLEYNEIDILSKLREVMEKSVEKECENEEL